MFWYFTLYLRLFSAYVAYSTWNMPLSTEFIDSMRLKSATTSRNSWDDQDKSSAADVVSLVLPLGSSDGVKPYCGLRGEAD